METQKKTIDTPPLTAEAKKSVVFEHVKRSPAVGLNFATRSNTTRINFKKEAINVKESQAAKEGKKRSN